MLSLISDQPGISGSELKRRLLGRGNWTLAKYNRVRGELESYITIFPRPRVDVDHHTHDASWIPIDTLLEILEGVNPLSSKIGVLYLEHVSDKIGKKSKCEAYFPVCRFLMK